MSARLVFVVPADLAKPTGGNRYDLALAGALRTMGTAVELRPVRGDWPVATADDREDLAHALRDSAPLLVDGLLASGAPGAVQRAVAAGSRVYVLVHMPLALRTGLTPEVAAVLDELERAALHAATGVLTTSHWAATVLRERHDLLEVEVAVPGTDPAPVSAGSTPPRLLHLASITPLKDQLTVVDALALVRDLPWTAALTGSLDVDPPYTAQVRAAIDRHRLGDRVRLTGPLGGLDVERAWRATNLLLLPSRAETWGMVVTEALARGVPAVVSLGTGSEEALGRADDGCLPGAAVPAGAPAALAAAIRDLLGPGRERARAAALMRRQTLRGWRETATDVLAAVS